MLPKYEITYGGKQPLDELSTYYFNVKPRTLERARAYFSGVVWVDSTDLVIVKTMGKWVTETGDVTAADLPFTVFETYRQQVGKNLWFPAYARSDESIPSGDGDISNPRDRQVDRFQARWRARRQRTAPALAKPSSATERLNSNAGSLPPIVDQKYFGPVVAGLGVSLHGYALAWRSEPRRSISRYASRRARFTPAVSVPAPREWANSRQASSRRRNSRAALGPLRTAPNLT